MSQTTLSTIPRLLAQVLNIYEVAPDTIFSQAGIDISPKSEERVPMEKMAKLWQLAVAATGNEQLGLVAASLFQPTYLKGIGLAWMASANLEEGLKRFVNNSQLINTAMNIKLVEQGDELLIQYQANPLPQQQIANKNFRTHKCAIELGIGFFLKMFRLAAGKNIPATAVYFNFAIAKDNTSYQEYFQCDIHQQQKFNGISFSKKLLSELLPTHDAELVELNEMAIAKHLSALNNEAVSNKVMKIINQLLPSGCPSEEVVAYQLHMSKRTLQRKLSEEKQSFSALLSSVRLLMAKQLLTMSANSVTEITYQLGYSSPSTFARAFKKQMQVSPAEYRNMQTNH